MRTGLLESLALKQRLVARTKTIRLCQTGDASDTGMSVRDTAMQEMSAVAAAAPGDKAPQEAACRAVQRACEALFSLNIFGLSLHMEGLMPAWLEVWRHWLDYTDASLKSADGDEESAECAPSPCPGFSLHCTGAC